MADYYSQMVVRPDIPKTAMSELEFRVLSSVFRHEVIGEDVYFYAPFGPNDSVAMDVPEVITMLAADDGIASSLAECLRDELAGLDPDTNELDFDLSVIGFEGIFQDVVKRSALDYIEVESAWSCSKMLSDGFGGSATLITAGDIEHVSTSDFLEQAIAKLPIGAPPG